MRDKNSIGRDKKTNSTGKQSRRKKQEIKMEQEARRYGMYPREWARLNAQEKVQKRKNFRLGLVMVILAAVACLLIYAVYFVILRSHDYHLRIPFDSTSAVYGMPGALQNPDRAEGTAASLCVTDTDVNVSAINIEADTAALFDLNNRDVLYAKDIFTERSEASLTKIMTALAAMKYGNMDDVVEVTDTALDIEYGSSVCDIKVGDRLTLKQLVYGMMIASGNDAAMMIAEHVGGSVDSFVQMMNDEAKSLGATRTHFMNPHGLTEEGHYTCAYDMYLIFNEAMKYDMFMDIINRKNYYCEYTKADGSAVAVTWESTDYYLTGEDGVETPDNVIVYGGKTGTTDDAGACLALLSKDFYGNPYFSIIMHASDHDALYDEMTTLLSLVPQ
jgi:D-alanyl-D-alanine carboxypeptidase